MATAGTVLNMIYKDAADGQKVISFRYADNTADATDIRALNTAILANKEIWDDQPITPVRAEMVTTEISTTDLSA